MRWLILHLLPLSSLIESTHSSWLVCVGVSTSSPWSDQTGSWALNKKARSDNWWQCTMKSDNSNWLLYLSNLCFNSLIFLSLSLSLTVNDVTISCSVSISRCLSIQMYKNNNVLLQDFKKNNCHSIYIESNSCYTTVIWMASSVQVYKCLSLLLKYKHTLYY